MKSLLILAIALFMGAGLTSCDDDSVEPMAITPTGTFEDEPLDDNDIDEEDFIEDEEVLVDEG